MATFNITADGIKAGVALAAPSTAIFLGGVFDGAQVRVEASPDNILWGVIARSQEISGIGQGQGAVAQCVLPSGWFVRTVTIKAGALTNVTVVIA
jgi:hypothetical protein